MTTNSHSHSHSHSDSDPSKEQKGHIHPHADPEGESASVTRIARLAMFLEAHFGEVELHMPEASDEEEQELGEDDKQPSLLVRLDDADAQISLITLVRSRSFLSPSVC